MKSMDKLTTGIVGVWTVCHGHMQETRIARLPVTAIPAGMKIQCVTAGSA